jgi:hypothetical protein
VKDAVKIKSFKRMCEQFCAHKLSAIFPAAAVRAVHEARTRAAGKFFYQELRRAGFCDLRLCRQFCMQNLLKYANCMGENYDFCWKNCYNSVLPISYINIRHIIII